MEYSLKPVVGYLGNADVFEEFFKRCIKNNAQTETERIKIMNELIKESMVIGLNSEDIARQIKGKRVLKITDDKTNTNHK